MHLDKLILVLTRQCNKSCSFCSFKLYPSRLPTFFGIQSIDLFYKKTKNKSDNLEIKFFGGEPLLEFSALRILIEYINFVFHAKLPTISITSNGTLMSDRIAQFLNEHTNIKFWISIYSNNNTKSSINTLKKILKLYPKLCVNLVITPSGAAYAHTLFNKLIAEGIVNFNILPVFYTYWDKKQLDDLKSALYNISSLVRSCAKVNYKLIIKNIHNHGSIPLFNDGLTVDTNGDLFLNNLILSKTFSKHKSKCVIGNISAIHEIQWNKKVNPGHLIQSTARNTIYKSTMEVNRILTNFVKLL